MLDVASVVDVDQSLQLAAFKAQLMPAEAMLRDPEQYHLVVEAMFEMMMGDMLSASEVARVNALRRAEHEVVFGVWELLLTQPVDEIASTVDAALAGYLARDVAYLALFGLDPGDDVGVHPIADHDGALAVRVDALHGAADHHRVGLADEVGLHTGRLRDHGGDRAGGG